MPLFTSFLSLCYLEDADFSTISLGDSYNAGVLHKSPTTVLALYQHGDTHYADVLLRDVIRRRTIILQTPAFGIPASKAA